MVCGLRIVQRSHCWRLPAPSHRFSIQSVDVGMYVCLCVCASLSLSPSLSLLVPPSLPPSLCLCCAGARSACPSEPMHVRLRACLRACVCLWNMEPVHGCVSLHSSKAAAVVFCSTNLSGWFWFVDVHIPGLLHLTSSRQVFCSRSVGKVSCCYCLVSAEAMQQCAGK